MASERRQLQLILDLKDNASKKLKGFSGKLEQMQPAFRKMAFAGTAAFTAVAATIGKTTQAAAVAEGSWNKFNTVFADGADEMREFVSDLRKEMPSATHEIARMAADLQDLLVPMGIARDEAQEMSQGFLEVSNKIAAFNDVDPSVVLEAIRSGLTGASRPLRQFGIDALETSLEARALEEGLIEVGQSFTDLEPQVKTQVRAQALLAQIYENSADAIDGFADNQDSFIRRQQELKATIGDLSVTLGNTFLPIIDSALKKILPVVEKISVWIEQNPTLARNIIIATGAIAGLVAVVGVLGLILPAVITGFSLLFSPVTLIVGAVMALIGVGILLSKNFENIAIKMKQLRQFIVGKLLGVWDRLKEKIQPVINVVDNLIGKLEAAISLISRLPGKIGGGIKSGIGAIGDFIGVNDAIITKDGKVIKTHPQDTIFATKNPGGMGGGLSITITGNTFMSDEDAAEKIGDMIIKRLKMSNKLV